MKLDRAQQFAAAIVGRLSPHCDRIAVGGSVRRQRPEVGDIEVVAIPATVPGVPSLFGAGPLVRDQRFVEIVDSWGHVKGDALAGRYMQRIITAEDLDIEGEDSIALDLFVADVDNFGHILAIRTGSAEYSRQVLAGGWVRAGYRSRDGYLRADLGTGDIVPVREERDLFELIGIPWAEPEMREVMA